MSPLFRPSPWFFALVLSQGLLAWCARDQDTWPLLPAFLATSFLLLSRVRPATLSLRTFFLISLFLRLLFLSVPIGLSDDIYRYLWDGEMTRNGVGPFHLAPVDVPVPLRPSGLFDQLNSPHYDSIYPPVAQICFWLASLFLSDPPSASILILRLILGLAEVTALYFLSLLARGNTSRLVWYAWNPFVLLETWGSPHVESLLLPCLAGFLLALTTRRPTTAALALTLATWTKLWPVLLFPFLLRQTSLRQWRNVLGISALASAALWLPFLSPEMTGGFARSADLYVRSFEFNAGFYYFLKWSSTEAGLLLGLLDPGSETSKIVGPLLRWLLLATVGFLFLYAWKTHPIRLTGWIYLAFLLSLTTVHPWYLLPIFLLLPLTTSSSAPWACLAISSAATYLFYSHGIYWPFVIVGWMLWGLLMFSEHLHRRQFPFPVLEDDGPGEPTTLQW
ncbi:MAG: hypothetical protein AAF191_14530 [Verrucomicrobiota bacterium]